MRSIGLLGASVAIIGFVVGASIFILPGALGATAGPAVVLSYAIAGLLAVFSCGVAAQLGCAFPVNGGSVVVTGTLTTPMVAFIVVWLILGGVVISIALMALGFADYFCFIWPALNRTAVAIAMVLALGAVNLLNIKSTLIGQGLLVAVSKLVLVVFCAAGILRMDFGNLVPFAPNGMGPVIAAAVPAFFSFSGFLVLLELGGEIKNPARNIPASIAISFIVVLIIYCLVSLVIVGNIPWTELSRVSAPASEVAQRIMPAGAALAIAVAAAAGAASTVNVLLLSYSRDIMVLGRLGVLPSTVSFVSSASGAPVYCIALLCGLSIALILAGATLVQYASVAVIGILLVQIVLAMAMLRLPSRRPDIYSASPFKLNRPTQLIFGLGLAALSLAMIVFSVWETPWTAFAALGYAAIGRGLYLWRRRMLRASGLDIDDLMRAELEHLLQPARKPQ